MNGIQKYIQKEETTNTKKPVLIYSGGVANRSENATASCLCLHTSAMASRERYYESHTAKSALIPAIKDIHGRKREDLAKSLFNTADSMECAPLYRHPRQKREAKLLARILINNLFNTADSMEWSGHYQKGVNSTDKVSMDDSLYYPIRSSEGPGGTKP